MTAWLIVRATVENEDDRAAFDEWYRTEHMPDALQAFDAASAWRGWSENDAAVHLAFYEFADAATAELVSDSDALLRMVAEFDRNWQHIPRTREIVECKQRLP